MENSERDKQNYYSKLSKLNDKDSQASCSIREEGVVGMPNAWVLESTLKCVNTIFALFGWAK